MFSVLLVVGIDDVLPLPFVAMTVKEPTAVEASVKVMVAEVPPPLMFTLETVIAAGVNAGTKENVGITAGGVGVGRLRFVPRSGWKAAS